MDHYDEPSNFNLLWWTEEEIIFGVIILQSFVVIETATVINYSGIYKVNMQCWEEEKSQDTIDWTSLIRCKL